MSDDQTPATMLSAPTTDSFPDRRRFALSVRADAGVERIGTLARAAREAGFDGLDLVFADLPIEQQVDLLCRLHGEHVPVVAVHTVTGSTTISEASESTARLLSAAGRAGARCLVLAMPPLHAFERAGAACAYQSAHNFAVAILQATRFEAERCGTAIALGVGPRGWLRSPVETRDIIDSANSWAVGASVDFDHDAEAGDPSDWIRTLTHRVHCVRIRVGRDARSSALEGLASVLEDDNYRRTICVDSGGDIASAGTALDGLRRAT